MCRLKLSLALYFFLWICPVLDESTTVYYFVFSMNCLESERWDKLCQVHSEEFPQSFELFLELTGFHLSASVEKNKKQKTCNFTNKDARHTSERPTHLGADREDHSIAACFYKVLKLTDCLKIDNNTVKMISLLIIDRKLLFSLYFL